MPPRPPADPSVERAGRNGWIRFWFHPADAAPLHALRVLTGLFIVVWLLSFVGRYSEWYSLDGLVGSQLLDRSRDFEGTGASDRIWAHYSRPSWSPIFAARGAGIHLLYWGGVAVALLFAVGFATRVTSVLTWLTVVSFASNPVFLSNGCESFLLYLSFYLMIGFIFMGIRNIGSGRSSSILGAGSLAGTLRKPEPPSVSANLALRCIQVHTAIALVALAMAKLQSSFWWEGLALWFPFHPAASFTLENVKQQREAGGNSFELAVLGLAAYLTVMWQISFPFFAWKRPLLAVAGGVVGMLFVSFAYQLPVMGPTFLLCTMAFLPAARWRSLLSRVWAPADEPRRNLND